MTLRAAIKLKGLLSRGHRSSCRPVPPLKQVNVSPSTFLNFPHYNLQLGLSDPDT